MSAQSKNFADSLRALTRNPSDPPGTSRRLALSGGTCSATKIIRKYVDEHEDPIQRRNEEDEAGDRLSGEKFDGLS